MKPDVPRLLDVHAAAAYLGGISTWTLRAYVADGHLRRVELPSVRHRGENSRRLLFDRADLDALIEKRRSA
ncbi:MAG TPA: hypothetical protein VNJ02_00290 [Vicinamibacterales bacterium]|nr:hypothetical protein [Vicinamibacterales bacterium]